MQPFTIQKKKINNKSYSTLCDNVKKKKECKKYFLFLLFIFCFSKKKKKTNITCDLNTGRHIAGNIFYFCRCLVTRNLTFTAWTRTKKCLPKKLASCLLVNILKTFCRYDLSKDFHLVNHDLS